MFRLRLESMKEQYKTLGQERSLGCSFDCGL